MKQNILSLKIDSIVYIGMSVTQTIRDEVEYINKTMEFIEKPLTNEEILKKLNEEKRKCFMSFSWGVWVTAYARRNLIENIIKLDKYVIYSDTDSLKMIKGFDQKVIDDYNIGCTEKIKAVCEYYDLDYERFRPKDKEGIEHLIGVFDLDGKYKKFITQGAKKYCVEKEVKKKKLNEKYQKVLSESDDSYTVLEITVAGVPKQGVYQLNKIDDFRNDLVFEFKNTNKNTLFYVEKQEPFELTDYLGNKEKVIDITGCCLVPCSYTLDKSQEYEDLLTDFSSKHARYNE